MAFIKRIIVGILTIEARLILKKYKPFIVAVTGSVGKTSTKDAIYDVLRSPAICLPDGGICHVRKSEKSMNSDIGLPLTVLGVPNAWYSVSGWVGNILTGLGLIFHRGEYPDCLVLEIGADHPGDIQNVCRWLKPDIAVVTKISRTPVHVEFFASPEEVFEEKAALAEAVKPGGTLVVFGDDERTASLGARVAGKGVNVLTFGISAAQDTDQNSSGSQLAVRASAPQAMMANDLPAGLSFTLEMDGESRQISVPGILGAGHIYPLLAAAAVGKIQKMSVDAIAKALNSYRAPAGRMNIIAGINGSVLIDDTYNSSPDAARSALETLGSLQAAGRKIAALGDMMELGKYAPDEHRTIGREAAAILGAEGLLITVGPRSQATAEEALKNGMPETSVRSCVSAEEAAEYLKPLIKAKDIIAIKGSQSVRMERLTFALMAEPARAAELLVRQEKEWLEKK